MSGHSPPSIAEERVRLRRRAWLVAGAFAVLLATLVGIKIGVSRPWTIVGNSVEPAPPPGVPLLAAPAEFSVPTDYGNICGKPPAEAARRRYQSICLAELALYPPGLWRAAQVRRVVLCDGLSFDGQFRSAVPDFGTGDLYFDVSRGAYSPFYLRHVIHHELYHLIDYRDDGQVYSDPVWSAINPPTFHYGTGGKNAQDRSMAGLWSLEHPGFLDEYATTGVEEDKAETFACMMVDPAYLAGRVRGDAVLAAKVARMRTLMVQFCPSMNDAFWAARLAAAPVRQPDDP